MTSAEHDQLMTLFNGLTPEQAAELGAVYKTQMHRRTRHPVTRVITVFEADGSTPFVEFNSNDDVSEITPK